LCHHLDSQLFADSLPILLSYQTWLRVILKTYFRYVELCARMRELSLYLKCAIPVFDGLLPDNNHNRIIQDLLFTLAHWHGLAKLRMHSDLTLDILDATTSELGNRYRQFKEVVCAGYDARELDREVRARSKRQTKEATRRTQAGQATLATTRRTQVDRVTLATDKPLHRKVSFNLQTYKFHALGDYVSCIRRFGTTDSYSTEPVCF
jgi:hypothetical protein